MTSGVTEFLKQIKEKIGKQERVLEIGSRGDVFIRDLFGDAGEFVGIDMVQGMFPEGRDVDVVMNSHDIKKQFREASFDCVICCETLEHDDKFWVTVENMKWALRPWGWMIITVPSIWCLEHKHPKDYWRFMRDSMDIFFEGFDDVRIEEEMVGGQTERPNAYFGIGKKP